MFRLQSTKANGIRTFEAAGKKLQYYMVLCWPVLYDVLEEHIISHIAVFACTWNTQGKKSESTSYSTQLSKAEANTFHKKAELASLLKTLKPSLNFFS